MSEINLEKFDQIGILVKDIEKAAEVYRALFKFKGEVNIVEQNANVNCRGEQGSYKMKKIMNFFGGKQLEIVEVVDKNGPNLYSDYIDQGKFGLHHMGIYVKDAKPIIDEFKKKFGIEIAQIGKVGKLKFTYLDTIDTLGYYLELIEF